VAGLPKVRETLLQNHNSKPKDPYKSGLDKRIILRKIGVRIVFERQKFCASLWISRPGADAINISGPSLGV